MTLRLPITSRGLDGEVVVLMRSNDDPVATGHDLVAADFEADAFSGFPR